MPGDFLTDDLDDMIDEDEFADSAVYTPKNGEAEEAVLGCFDEDILQGNIYTNDVETPRALFHAKTTDVNHWRRNGTVTINSVDYTIINDSVPDGTGMSEVPLKRTIETRI